MNDLRFGVIGCGFWARFQIAAWRELTGATLVAVCDRDAERAGELARRFGVSGVYTDAGEMLRREALDFVDIITDVGSHADFVRLAAGRGVAAITQKPMAPDLATARGMVEAARDAGVVLLVHENFRWQAPLRRVKALLDAGVVGEPFRGRLSFCSAFPVYDNQPALAELEQFILTDVGTHVLDVARFLFGETRSVFCQTKRVNQKIRGEDVATALLGMDNGVHCTVELSYASRLEREAFPQTLALVEGRDGSLRLGLDGEIAVTTRAGTTRETVTAPTYPWADPAYALIQASLVDCQRNLLAGLRAEGEPETTGADNLKTLRLVFACYESARTHRAVNLTEEEA